MSDDLSRLFALTRQNAAEDLRFSNEILETVDQLLKEAAENGWNEEKVKSKAERLIQIAMGLTNQSSTTSSLIAKIVGAK